MKVKTLRVAIAYIAQLHALVRDHDRRHASVNINARDSSHGLNLSCGNHNLYRLQLQHGQFKYHDDHTQVSQTIGTEVFMDPSFGWDGRVVWMGR